MKDTSIRFNDAQPQSNHDFENIVAPNEPFCTRFSYNGTYGYNFRSHLNTSNILVKYIILLDYLN